MEYSRHKRTAFTMSWLLAVALAALCGVIAYISYASQKVEAGANRLGTSQVTLNPGGGILANGTDGLRFTINGDQRYVTQNYDALNDGQDGVVYRATRQYCCSGGSPMLNVGGTLYGQAGPDGDDWSSIQIISTSGAASVGARTSTTGNSSATIRYTAVKNSRTYTVDRTVSYLYPNDFVTDSYSFAIPAGNTDAVKFYLGGDTAPGSSDQGYGIMLTSPVRSIISLNTSSKIMFGFREIQGSRTFDGATSQNYNAPYSTVESGGNIGFVGTASNHDAGLMMQWNLGSTPGTYTGAFEQFVTKQGTNLNAVFAEPRADIDEGVSLNISIVNSELSTVTGLGYTLTLPSGVTIDGVATSNCGGTLSAANGTGVIMLSGVSVAGAANCVISVPVSASIPGSYAITSANATNLQGVMTNNIGVSRLNVAVYILSYATQGGNTIADGIYELGNSATLPSATRAGFTFQGWNTVANGTGTAYTAGANLTMPANDITLYAQWQAIPYSLTFNTQGGSSISTLSNQTAGTEVQLTTPTRSGYIFKRWNTTADNSGTSYTGSAVYTVPAANTTLYAIWAKSVVISYNTQGGNNVSSITREEATNTSIAGTPTRTGYTFVQWNTAANGSGHAASSQLTVPGANITLYAIWEDNDGLSMALENAAPNNGDANNDGTPDSQQAGVSSFVNTVTSKPLALEINSSSECFLGDVSVKASGDLASDATHTYPLGLLDFAVECGANGFTATVKQYFYDAAINGFVLRKYIDGKYATVGGASFDIQTIAGRQVLVVSYDVTDGGPLDADGIVDGIIVDPAGPAVAIAAATAPAASAEVPDTGLKAGSITSFVVLGGIGLASVGLGASGLLKTRFSRG